MDCELIAYATATCSTATSYGALGETSRVSMTTAVCVYGIENEDTNARRSWISRRSGAFCAGRVITCIVRKSSIPLKICTLSKRKYLAYSPCSWTARRRPHPESDLANGVVPHIALPNGIGTGPTQKRVPDQFF
jgi:hypothetical protein